MSLLQRSFGGLLLVPLGLCSIVAFVPLAVVVGGVFSPPVTGGFATEGRTLQLLVQSSLVFSVIPSLLATGISLVASAESLAHSPFRRTYEGWLTAMLFTNPIFLVLGLATLSMKSSPTISVLCVTTYLVWPLVGLIVHSAFKSIPAAELSAARSLGGKMFAFAFTRILRKDSQTVVLALFLGTSYAVGFYLLPAYVGLGTIPTLATTVQLQINQLGNWEAAQQLAAIVMIIPIVLALILSISFICVRRYL